jgi:hypothetical protein
LTEKNKKDDPDFTWSGPQSVEPKDKIDIKFTDLGDSSEVPTGEAQSVEPKDKIDIKFTDPGDSSEIPPVEAQSVEPKKPEIKIKIKKEDE